MRQENNNDFIKSIDEFNENKSDNKSMINKLINKCVQNPILITGEVFLLSSTIIALSVFIQFLMPLDFIFLVVPYAMVILLLFMARLNFFTKKYFIIIISIFILSLLLVIISISLVDDGFGKLAIFGYGFFIIAFINFLIGLSLLITDILKNKK